LADTNIAAVAAMTVGYLIASGGETTVAVTSSAAERSTHIAARITGWHGTTPPEISAVASGSSTAPNPSSVTASWGSADNLFIALYGVDSGAPTAYPTNYSLAQTTTTTTPTSAAYGGMAARQVAAASDDPGAFTNSTSDDWRAYTVVVRPAPSGSLVSRTAADSLGLANSVARSGGFLRTAGDSLGLAQAVTRAGSFFRTAGDTLTLANLVTRIGTFLRTVGGGSLATPALVQSKAFQLLNSSVSFDATATAGNLLVLLVGRRDSTTIPVPSGWTNIPEGTWATAESRGGALFYKVSDGTETSVALTGSIGAIFAEFSGVNGSSLLDSAVSTPVSGTTYEAGGNVDGSAAGRIIVIGGDTGDYFGSGSDVTATGGTTEVGEIANLGGEKPGVWLGYKVVTSPSSAEKVSATSVNASHIGGTVAFGASGSSGDSISLASVVAGLKITSRTAADSLGFSDAVTRAMTMARTAADSLGLGNAVTRTATYLRTTADSLGLGNAATRVLTAVRTAADTVTFTESVERVSTVVSRTVSDALGLADAAVRTLTSVRSLSDTLTHSNTVTRVGTFLRSAADALSLANIADGAKVNLRSAADSISFGNTATRTGAFLRTATDGLTLGNAVSRTGTFLRSTADALGLSTAVTRAVTIIRSAADSMTTATSVAAQSVIARSASDALSFVDSVVASVGGGLVVIGGIPPRIGAVVRGGLRAIAARVYPEGGRSDHSTPDGHGDHPKPGG
jgi:hypothetical protein